MGEGKTGLIYSGTAELILVNRLCSDRYKPTKLR